MSRIQIYSLLALAGLIVIGARIGISQSTGNSPSPVWNLPSPTSTGNASMLLQSGLSTSGANQVILVDTTKQVMAVYSIAPDTGVIQLKSVRNLAADLLLEEFNGSDPSPSKVRSILNQR